MSIKIMTVVWGLSLPHTEKLVLLALADNASDEGKCYPSVATLVAKCSLSDRAVQLAMTRLVAAGHLTKHERSGRSTVYDVHPRMAFTPEQNSPPNGVHPERNSPTPERRSPPPPKDVRGTPERRSPITVIEPSVEPSSNHARSARASVDEPPEFAEIRQIHPRRSGGQRWGDAVRAYLRRRAEGHSHETIRDGTQRYANWCDAVGKTGTEGVQQAATFLGENRGFLEQWSIPAEATADKRRANAQRLWDEATAAIDAVRGRKGLTWADADSRLEPLAIEAIRAVGGHLAIANRTNFTSGELKRRFLERAEGGKPEPAESTSTPAPRPELMHLASAALDSLSS